VTQGVGRRRKAAIRVQFAANSADSTFRLRSGGIDRGLFDQQYRQAVAHGIHPMARCAFQRFRIRLQFQILLARRANDQVEEVLGNHVERLYDDQKAFSPRRYRNQRGILRFWSFDFRLRIGWKISRSLHTKPAYLGMNAGFCPWSFSVVCLSPWGNGFPSLELS